MSERPYIAVVGALNTDIGGISFGRFSPFESNPGTVIRSFGGAGHNIAYNIALLGIPVKFITAFGDDSDDAKCHCEDIGLDISDSITVKNEKASVYLYINDNKGETVAAVSDMRIYDRLTPEFIRSKMDVLNGAHAVAADANIPAETIEYIAKNCAVPVICDPVPSAKAERVKSALPWLAAVKPNRYEAEELTGIRITDKESAVRAAEALRGLGVGKVFLTLGKDGAVCADENGTAVMSSYISDPLNVTGAGDAFCAAATVSLCANVSAETAGRFGLAAAALTAKYDGSVDPGISMARIKELLLKGE